MRSRQAPTTWLIFAALLFIALPACEKPRAKFHPGDKVRVKFTQTDGVVVLRTQFFRENLYHITVAGTNREHYPVGENKQRLALMAEAASSESLKPWHDEGPYYESQLEFVPQ